MNASQLLKAKKQLKLQKQSERKDKPRSLTATQKNVLWVRQQIDKDIALKHRKEVVDYCYGPVELFVDDLLNGEMNLINYEIERGVTRELPAIIFDDGAHQNASDAFDLMVEYTYQLLRFTKDYRLNQYIQDQDKFIPVIHDIINDRLKEPEKSLLLELKAFISDSKQIAQGISVEVTDRVIGEIQKVTRPQVEAGKTFTIRMLRQWLVDMGR